MFAKTPLQMVARAKALCMVVILQDWKPVDGNIVQGCIFESKTYDDNSQAADRINFEKCTTIRFAKTTDSHVSTKEIQSDVS